MKYYFILGNNTALSIAEIEAVLPNISEKFLLGNNVFIVDAPKFNEKQIIRRLGGTIKIGILHSESKKDYKILQSDIFKLINTDKKEGKYKFGISYYGAAKLNTKAIGMEVKKELKNSGISVRWVTSKEPTLSSVVVEQNKLTGKGAEVVLIQKENSILIGKTLAVQPFKELSHRDYGRPGRDDLSGMLPPKLAQILINLSSPEADSVIFDPFCGSGTVLTEALLMGFKNIIGADNSAKAIADTEKNISWIKRYSQNTPSIEASVAQEANYRLHHISATEISKVLKPGSVGAIATEPYLGPQRGKIEISKVRSELENLYSKSLAEFYKILKRGGRVAMVWPVFQIKEKSNFLSPNLSGFKIITPVSSEMLSNKILKVTQRNSIIYGRPDQRVWREIIILQK